MGKFYNIKGLKSASSIKEDALFQSILQELLLENYNNYFVKETNLRYIDFMAKDKIKPIIQLLLSGEFS
ncbi:MAG: hypothetical protein K0Q87_812 [Neobacillus sp.]|jgi:hypothetical protein|nr:hypothetical protein [Neobacillus sp.]